MSVYFAAVSGYIKVGFSSDPVKRVGTTTVDKTIKPTGVHGGDEVTLLGWFPGDRKAERLAHEALAPYRAAGEWFIDCPAVRAYMLDRTEAVDFSRLTMSAYLKIRAGMSYAEATALYPSRSAREVLAEILAIRGPRSDAA